MVDRLVDIRQWLDKIRDIKEAELLKGPLRDKDLVESWQAAEDGLLKELEITENQGEL